MDDKNRSLFGAAAYQHVSRAAPQPESVSASSPAQNAADFPLPEKTVFTNDPRTAAPQKSAVETVRFAPLMKKSKEEKYKEIAEYLILVGADKAAAILKGLSEEQVEAICGQVAQIKTIDKDEAAKVLAEFETLFNLKNGFVQVTGQKGKAGAKQGFNLQTQGGPEAARQLLYDVYGPEFGETMYRRAMPDAQNLAFNFLENYSPEQVALLLSQESSQTQAMILSRLSPKLSAQVLAQMDRKRKLDVVMRIAKIGDIAPEVIENTAEVLRHKAEKATQYLPDKPDGLNTLAKILKESDISFGEKILEELDREDPSLGSELKHKLYTIDDICKADDKAIAAKLREMREADIALLIRGRPQNFVDKIMKNLSAHRKILVQQENEFMGPVHRKDCDAALGNFLAWFRHGKETGDILSEGEDIVV
jgi:flagellar motor switch protein FliG